MEAKTGSTLKAVIFLYKPRDQKGFSVLNRRWPNIETVLGEWPVFAGY